MSSNSSSRTNRFKEFASESVNPEDLLDTKEQQDLIAKFVEQNNSSNAWFQNVITLAGFAFGAAKLYYMISQMIWPWFLQPHALYVDSVPSSIIILWEAISCLSFFLIAMAMHPAFGLSVGLRRRIHVGVGISYLVVFFTWLVYRGLDISPEVIWFVGGNITTHALALYAEYLIADSARHIEALKTVQYRYNKP